MNHVRLAVIYYSTYGTNHAMAEEGAAAAREAGADVRLLRVRETAPPEVVRATEAWAKHADKTAGVPEVGNADMEWANAYLFSAPTRFGTVASQLRSFIDSLGPLWQAGHLSNKPVSAMTSAQNMHGGQETTLLGLYATFMHWGAILVPPGYTDPSAYAAGGNPYGTSVTAGGAGLTAEIRTAIRAQSTRLVKFAEYIACCGEPGALKVK